MIKYLTICLFMCFLLAGCQTSKRVWNAIPLLPDVEIDVPSNTRDKVDNGGISTDTAKGERLYYGLGALVALIGVGFLVVAKDTKRAIYCGIGALCICTVPFYIDVLHTILGEFKWALKIIVMCGVGAFLVWFFFFMKNVIYDLANPDCEDKCKESAKIRDAVGKNNKDIKK